MPSIGEESIPQQTVQGVAQNIDPQALQQKMASTVAEKGKLDFILKGIADKVGADFESRTKQPETILRKVAQKRMEGRNYNLDNINDAYGGRFIIKNDRQENQIKSMLSKAADLGIFKINKQQNVKSDTYSAFHTDIETPTGVKGEIQIHTPQSALESIANHSIRSVFGEKPPDQVDDLKKKQAKIADKTPNSTAINKAATIQSLAKQNNGKPLDPRIIAGILGSR